SEALARDVLGRRGRTTNGGGGRASAPAVALRPALDRTERTERSFLALCLAMPVDGAARLREMAIDDYFTSPLTRRAAAFVRDNAAAPSVGSIAEDPELVALIAELNDQAHREEPSAATLAVEALQLDLARVERQIAAARVQGSEVRDLAAKRQRVREAIRHALH
ncbi:MAG TPA: hypothetical protein VF533_04210, partial [Solirubrobacteraceae bacterium]